MFQQSKSAPEFCGLAASGNLVEIENALKSGASANSVDQRGTPAVFYALQSPQPRAVIELLLRYGANYFDGPVAENVPEQVPPFEAAIHLRIQQDPSRAEELRGILEIHGIRKFLRSKVDDL